MPRIGVLGGTFDPPHLGHLALARAALKECKLDRMIFVPAKYPPHKPASDVSSEFDRLNMLKLALEGHPEFEISDLELKRNGLSYSVDTLKEIKKLYPRYEIFFIIGADNISEMESWYNPEEILEIATVAAFTRPGFAPQGKFATMIRQFEMKPVDISSTDIRAKIRNKESVTALVPGPTLEYIIDNNLYGN